MLTRTLTVALVGNPNTGKTTLFNALSGLRHRVGNYPGVTVEMKKGRAGRGDRTFDLIDLPGTYSLAARSPDEMVAVDLLLGQCPGENRPDVIIGIVDASNLERHLYLTTQLLELGTPVVLALNMVDVAAAQGVRLNVALLRQRLGLPVVAIQANKSMGLEDLKRAVVAAAGEKPPANRPVFPEPFEHEVSVLSANEVGVPPFLARRILLDVDGHAQRRFAEADRNGRLSRLIEARQRLDAAGCSVPLVEARTRYAWIRETLF